jgi:hypothetical protein
MHLYPALEGLAEVAEKMERSRLGLTDKEAHARHRAVNVKDPNWNYVFLGGIRRDLICKGDAATYRTARAASNGLEHGFANMASIRADAQQVTPKVFEYVRGGVLDLLDLDAGVRERLGKMKLVDVTPMYAVITGVLSGDVGDADRLGFGSDPYPRMDSQVQIDDLTYLPDGRLTVSPSFTYTVRTAEGVAFTPQMSPTAVGLNDPSGFLATATATAE